MRLNMLPHQVVPFAERQIWEAPEKVAALIIATPPTCYETSPGLAKLTRESERSHGARTKVCPALRAESPTCAGARCEACCSEMLAAFARDEKSSMPRFGSSQEGCCEQGMVGMIQKRLLVELATDISALHHEP